MIYKQILKQYWGHDDFRGIQREIIESIGAGRDTLGLMPTGGGKSIAFQVPALSMPGVCIVVTPLISLMKDQVDNLLKRGIVAYALYSGLTHGDIVRILDNCIYGDVKFLYISPERLASSFFIAKLQNINVSFITVDEAHCISQWGYDFRPAYLKIADIRKIIPGKPVLALTATATPEVVEDIQEKLLFSEHNVFRMSFKRDNIAYVIRPTHDKQRELLHIINNVKGSVIVYTYSRKKTRDICKLLLQENISASFYHAGLDIAVKTKRQSDWQNGTIRVIVATNAFGMGIDKSDVRLVIHYDVPSSIEAYFQEAGRAGRDGKLSYAVLLTDKHTKSVLKKRISQSFPPKDQIQNIYDHLAYNQEIGIGMGQDYSFIFNIDKFCYLYNFSPLIVHSALHILSNAGYIHYETEPDSQSRVKFIVQRDDLYLLRSITRHEDMLINEMMRIYTGLFTDYAYIDEGTLAVRLGFSKEQVYAMLINLQRQQIIRFIPPRTDPRITYLVNRVDGCDVVLRHNVYDALKQVMEKHINAMIGYIECDTICRQEQLIRYFGEDSNCRCGKCEVCLSNNETVQTVRNQSQKDIKDGIMNILSDKHPHHISEFLKLPYNPEQIQEAITTLLEEQAITSDSLNLSVKIG